MWRSAEWHKDSMLETLIAGQLPLMIVRLRVTSSSLYT